MKQLAKDIQLRFGPLRVTQPYANAAFFSYSTSRRLCTHHLRNLSLDVPDKEFPLPRFACFRLSGPSPGFLRVRRFASRLDDSSTRGAPKSATGSKLTVCKEGELHMGRRSQYRKFTEACRELAVRRLRECENVLELCREMRISRQLLYRWRDRLEHRGRYGYRRVSREFRRRGLVVNHKRVARLMREDNLLAIQPRAWVQTTDSDHELKVYLNLAARMQLTGINQLWVADITYIRLRTEFVYLAVVLDAWSRKVVGWALGRSLAAQLTVVALEQAIAQRKPMPGLVHHSDRGSQYACREYVNLLASQGMVPSMSRPANPYDNASCESFMRTLKREEIYANTYRDLEDLRAHIEEFIERYYNRIRLHSALGYLTAGGVRSPGTGLPRLRIKVSVLSEGTVSPGSLN